MIRVGIVGCGYWGPHLVRNFAVLPGAKLTWACDLDKKRLADIQAQYPTVKTTQNFKDVLNDPDLDAIVIATPVESHFALASKALKAGKHVLIEKPMATSVRECEQLIRVAKQKKLTLMVGHTFIYTGAVRYMKKYIDQHLIGDIYYIDASRINLGLVQNNINVVWDLAPHDISIMLYLLGTSPTHVHATGRRFVGRKQEEMAYITLTFPGNIIAQINVSWLSPVKVRAMVIGGSKKMIRYDDIEPTEKIRIYDKGVRIDPEIKKDETPSAPVYRAGDILIPKIDTTEPLATECRHFIECIRKSQAPITDGMSGLAVVRVLEAATQSMRKGRSIQIPLSRSSKTRSSKT